MSGGDPASDVVTYKRILQTVCDNRPSGMRGRLAVALSTNRSFVSQMVNPAYAMPIPAQHLPTIFEVCHFSPTDRSAFLDAYDRAHPGRRDGQDGEVAGRFISLRVPDLGDPDRNAAVDELLIEHARTLVRLLRIERQ